MQALGATPIALPDGRWTRLDDIAVLRDGAGEARTRPGWTARRWWASPCSAPRGPAIRVAQGVEHALEQLRRQHADVDIQLVSSSVAYTLASYDAAIMTLVEAPR